MNDSRHNDSDCENMRDTAPTAALSGAEAETVMSLPKSRHNPHKIGQYVIKQILATGGMGTVYIAVQEHPKRTVALKVMKKGIVSAATLKRFEFESQVLARLRHPNIGQIFESGTFDDGEGSVPYFAMEYIPNAKTIEEHVRSKSLGTKEILSIFTKVCDAVHHGHQKGVIHRDLKPDNILVDPSGTPKIIDFGVARSTESDLAISTMQTDVGQLIGTLQYMSPEQCNADPHDLDTRTDVYSLGVVLYELLCGTLPYDVSKVAIFEAARVIKETQPQRPSTLNLALRGDLETITLKSLEKDRDRRYQSASALADDLHRYIKNEPIQARSPSMAYQTKMFVRRNRSAFAAAVSIFVFMVIASIVSITFGIQAVKSGREAKAAELDALTQRDIAVEAQIEAQEAREESDRQRDAALVAEALAEKQSYIVNVAAAASALDNKDIATAKRRLRLAPKRLRNWEWQYLSNLADQSIETISGHESLITSVAFSANGSSIVSGSTDGQIRSFDLATGKESVQFAGHDSPVYAIACSPDGQHIASASADMTVRIWNMLTGVELAVLRGHEGVVTSLTYDARNRFIVSGSSDASLRLWNAVSGEEISRIDVDDTSIDCVAISPDGTKLATGSDDGLIRLWDASTGELAWERDVEADFINALRFTADGSRLGSATEDGIVRLWNTQNGSIISQFIGHTGYVSDIAFSPDSTLLVSGSEDGTVRLWNLLTGEQSIQLHGHDGFVNGVAFSPDGRSVASCSDDQTIKLWDAYQFDHVEQTPSTEPTSSSPRVSAIAMSVHGARVIAGRYDGSVAFFDALSGARLGALAAHSDPIRSIAVSSSGSLLATASDDNTIKIWDSVTAKLLGTLSGHTRRVTSMVFREEDSQLLSGSWDGTIRVWDLKAHSQDDIWEIEDGSINAIALGPNDATLACASSNGDIIIVDLNTGEHSSTLSGHEGPVNCLVYNSYGTRLISGSSDATVRLWDTSSGELVSILRGHSHAITSLQLTADEQRIITASQDMTMRVWTDTGEEVATLPWQSSGVTCISVSPDGYQIAAGASDGSITVRDSMPRIRRFEQRTDSLLINGSARREIDAHLRAGLSEAEAAKLILSDDSLSDTHQKAAMNRILQISLEAKGES